jgi:hypothetical protein
MSKSNKYGYSGVDIPTQAAFANVGKFDPAEINELVQEDKWTQYGQLELIETQTVSSVSQVDFTNLGNYNVHFLTGTSLESSANNVRYSVRFYESGVLETASVYKYAYQQITQSSAPEFKDTANSSIPIQIEQPTGFLGGGYTYFYNLIDSTKYSFLTNQHNRISNSMIAEFGSGVMPQTSEVTGIQIRAYDSSLATFNASFSLYGIKEYS